MIKTDTQSTNVSFCFYSNLILTLLIQHSAYDREERYYIIRGKRMVQKNKERKKERKNRWDVEQSTRAAYSKQYDFPSHFNNHLYLPMSLICPVS